MRISDWSSDVCSSDLLHRLCRYHTPEQLKADALYLFHIPLRSLSSPHRSIEPPTRQQRRVAPALRYLASLQHDNFVRVDHGGEPVRNDDGGASPRYRIERCLNVRLRTAIECTCRFIENQDGRLLKECPRNRHTLLLPPGKLEATLADASVKEIGRASCGERGCQTG